MKLILTGKLFIYSYFIYILLKISYDFIEIVRFFQNFNKLLYHLF